MTLTRVNKAKDVVKTTKEPVIIDERIVGFDGDGDVPGDGKAIDFDKDVYVILFTGRRGGGKTTLMTFYSVLAWRFYRRQIVSNFPIEFKMRRFRPDGKSYLEHVKSIPFDFERLILEPEGVRDSILVIDEAPDFISHMAASSIKNKLIDAFTRQIRKNNNVLYMGAQNEMWVDKGMRWQVDIRIDCKDIARALDDNSGLKRGSCIQATLYDESGQWTDEPYYEADVKAGIQPWAARYHIAPGVLFGDDTHFPVFDSFAQIDILESLRKVELRMSKIRLGDNAPSSPSNTRLDVNREVLLKALGYIGYAMENDTPESAHFQKHFYKSINAGERDKNNLGKILSQFNVEKGSYGADKRWYGFQGFDFDGFRGYVEAVTGG